MHSNQRQTQKVRLIKPSPIVVDKISMVAPSNDYDVCVLESRIFESSVFKKVADSRYENAFVTYIDGSLLRIQTRNRFSGFDEYRVEFNPNTPLKRVLKETLELVLPDGYDNLLETAHVTRIDLTIDLLGRHIEDLMIYVPKAQINEVHSSRGKLTGIYIGAKNSDRRFLIYDKIKELAKKQKVNTYPDGIDVTRFEYILRPRGKAFRDLYDLHNQFEKVCLYDLRLSSDDSREHLHFINSCKGRGLNNVLCQFDHGERRRLKKTLDNLKPRYWKPDALWSGWFDALLNVEKL